MIPTVSYGCFTSSGVAKTTTSSVGESGSYRCEPVGVTDVVAHAESTNAATPTRKRTACGPRPSMGVAPTARRQAEAEAGTQAVAGE